MLLAPLPAIGGGYDVNHNWTVTIAGERFGLIERTDLTTNPKITHTTIYAAGKALRVHTPATVVAGTAALLTLAAIAVLASLRSFIKKPTNAGSPS